MIIPDLNSRLTESVSSHYDKPQKEEKESFIDAYMHALYNVKEEAKRMMISRDKNGKKYGVKLYSAVDEFIDYLERSTKDVEDILKNEGLVGRIYTANIERALEDIIKTEAYLTRNGRTVLQRAIRDVKKKILTSG